MIDELIEILELISDERFVKVATIVVTVIAAVVIVVISFFI